MVIIRDVYKKLLTEINDKGVSILVGARQVGKTFILKQLKADTDKIGRRTAYYDLEMPGDLRVFNDTEEQIFKRIILSGEVIFIDEFHYIKNASKIFKMIYDSGKKIKIYASGSSALEIHKHLKESLAGRRCITKLMPLSYAEFLQKFSGKTSTKTFEEYAVYGGLPGLLKAENADKKIDLLNEIFEAYIQKDIKSLIKEENIRAFNSLIYLLAENQGSIISENSLSREVGLTAVTINKHISILEKTYVCYPVYSYARKLGNELKKSKKIYLYDIGIRNALLKDFSAYEARQDKGVIGETFVLLQILSILRPNMEIRFWRNKSGHEIDFIVIKNRKPFLLEVKTSVSSPEVPKAFSIFIKNYPETVGGMVVSGNYRGNTFLNGKEIVFSTFNEFVPRIVDIFAKI